MVSKKILIKDKLIEIIKSGNYSQGEKLPSERELAQKLEVSRNAVREAIISLVSAGILEVRERQGLFIKSLCGDSDLDALNSMQMLPADFISYQMEVRMIISVPATELAAFRRTDEDLQKLWKCYKSFVNCPYSTAEEQIQNGKWEALLHHLVTEAAHNPILSRINESINTIVERNNSLIHPYTLHEIGWMEHIQKQHYKIIQALESHDSNSAGKILREHLVDSVQMIREKYPNLITDLPHPYWTL